MSLFRDILNRVLDKVRADREAKAKEEARSEGLLGPTDTPIEREASAPDIDRGAGVDNPSAADEPGP